MRNSPIRNGPPTWLVIAMISMVRSLLIIRIQAYD